MNVREVVAILQRVNPEAELGVSVSDLLHAVGGLSPREMEVLQHLAKGGTLREIAAELYVSLNTVRNHVARILEKTNTHSTREAVVSAVRAGLLTVDDLGRSQEGDDVSPQPTRGAAA